MRNKSIRVNRFSIIRHCSHLPSTISMNTMFDRHVGTALTACSQLTFAFALTPMFALNFHIMFMVTQTQM